MNPEQTPPDPSFEGRWQNLLEHYRRAARGEAFIWREYVRDLWALATHRFSLAAAFLICLSVFIGFAVGIFGY